MFEEKRGRFWGGMGVKPPQERPRNAPGSGWPTEPPAAGGAYGLRTWGTPMPFYLRKSLSLGPIRFNLSKSGLGASVGVTGMRLAHELVLGYLEFAGLPST